MSAGGRPTLRHGVHGIVTVELVDAEPAHRQWLLSVLGPSRDPSHEADVVIRFVDDLHTGDLTQVGPDAAFGGGKFYIGAEGRRTEIDLAHAGDVTVLQCERGVPAVPLLIPLLAARLAGRGHVLLHASSFVHNGVGVIVAGWEGGGKTEMLLPFVAHGADLVSDEWTIVGPPGEPFYGLAGSVQLWDWQLRQLPALRRRLGPVRRARMSVASALLSHMEHGKERSSVPRRLVRELRAPLRHNARTTGPPEQLFGCEPAPVGPPPDVVILATVVDRPETTIRPVTSDEIAQRMVASLAFERRALLEAYAKFRFAFPDGRNSSLERLPAVEEQILRVAFGPCRAYAVEHPKPLSLNDLYAVAAPVLAR